MHTNTTKLSVNHAANKIKQIISSDKIPFTNVLSKESIDKKLKDINYRNRIFTPDMTIFTFLSQVLGKNKSCQSAVSKTIAQFSLKNSGVQVSANTSAYCQARARLPDEILPSLAKESAVELEKQIEKTWLFHGRHIKLIDGTTFSMPDTKENQLVYPQSSDQKVGVGCPIARAVGIFSLSTGALFDLSIGPYAGKGTGEHALLRKLLDNFNEKDIAIGDAYYCSYFLIAELMRRKVDIIFPMNSARKFDFRKGKKIGKRDHLVIWKKTKKPAWMSREEYNELPDQITLRETKITSSNKGFRSKSIVIVTTLVDNSIISSSDLSKLYSLRWHVELNLLYIKTVMNMGILSSKSPGMIHKEIWTHLLAYNLIRKIMAQSASIYQINPNQISFSATLYTFFEFRNNPNFFDGSESYYLFLRLIVYKKVGNRSGRSEPRMIKRRRKRDFSEMKKPRNRYIRCKVA